MDKIEAPCSDCIRTTHQNVLYSTRRLDDEKYDLIECGSCGNISLRRELPHPEQGHEPIVNYFPSQVSRRRPDWLWQIAWGIAGEGSSGELYDLFKEVYEALEGGQLRLAAIGIRSLLEQIMIMKVGDRGSFGRNLNAFHARGFISLVQYDQMNAILDAGHAVTHRLFNPKKEELNTALDIAEGIFAAIADRLPPDTRKP